MNTEETKADTYMSVVPHFVALPFYFELEEGRPDGVDDGRVPGLVQAEVIFDPFKTTGICAQALQESPRHATARQAGQLKQSINVNHFVLNSFQNQAFYT